MGGSVWIDFGAIGWGDKFLYANNLDDYMKYLSQKVKYGLVKNLANSPFVKKSIGYHFGTYVLI